MIFESDSGDNKVSFKPFGQPESPGPLGTDTFFNPVFGYRG